MASARACPGYNGGRRAVGDQGHEEALGEVPREGVGPQIGERQRRGGLRGRARSCRPDRAEWGLIGD